MEHFPKEFTLADLGGWRAAFCDQNKKKNPLISSTILNGFCFVIHRSYNMLRIAIIAQKVF